MTFSMGARDLQAGEWGVAVQAKCVAIGALTPWARAGVGASATQAWINTTSGTRGLELLASGSTPGEIIAHLTSEDEERAHRQVGISGVRAEPATCTGQACPAWAGRCIGTHYACQGNCLVGDTPLLAMAQTFEEVQGPVSKRLILALEAAQEGGGDRGGQQSAALLVVRAHSGVRGFTDRLLDLRVDDHPTPIKEWRRILSVRLAATNWVSRG